MEVTKRQTRIEAVETKGDRRYNIIYTLSEDGMLVSAEITVYRDGSHIGNASLNESGGISTSVWGGRDTSAVRDIADIADELEALGSLPDNEE